MNIPDAKAAFGKEMEQVNKSDSMARKERNRKQQVVEEARKEGMTIHCATLMDLCLIKNSEVDKIFPKYNGRLVLHGDEVKDDSGSYAVLTEQGSSASHMTAAKALDVSSRLPGCASEASDAVSAYTQVKMEDAPKLWRLSESECPVNMETFTTFSMSKIMELHNTSRSFIVNARVWTLPSRFFCRNANLTKLEEGWEKVPGWRMFVITSRTRVCFSLISQSPARSRV